MGLLLSRVLDLFSGHKNVRILLIGLDSAGKTTLLYKLKLNENVTTIPTVGFNVETVTYKNLEFTMWDIGGQNRIRPLWKHYFNDTQAVIFVVDCNDLDRIDEAKVELENIMRDPAMPAKHLLVYANKQDCKGAMLPNVLAERLELNKFTNVSWFVQKSIATEGTGLYEGLQWLSQQMK